MLFDKIRKVKVLVFDVDGVLTDGKVLVTENGDQLRTFNIRDGYALQLAVKREMPVVVITGGKSQGVLMRLSGLHVKHIFLGVNNKIKVLKEWLDDHRFNLDDVLYMGDDMPDLGVMKLVGMAACPADAIEEVKSISHYISAREGGRGAVRDVIEKVLKLQGKWDHENVVKSI
ncbi:HAD-IIIA family hydrolase [Olivibacter sp. SDN3]|uniref:KdsC family phosphatase n=1 Tax=Olivibacter sp. SDN3 TaxID=2764720 RepID=UPI001651580B|nr:HAD-IIIA family hydrolase [Olivibacter sp. SDN3]QNL48421.1 HAD-IIIA family hydrolase [Olivibacter sp. SDN3]